MKVEFFSLKRQVRDIDRQIFAAVNSVLKSGNFILGKNVSCFEKEFARSMGSRFAVGVASGTDALFLALTALGIGKGDEVITVPNTAVATVAAIQQAGASPVFVDVGEDYLIDVRKIEKAISRKTRVIIPVHLYGCMADMDSITAIAKQRKLSVIEDAAQAHGARLKGRNAGTWGAAGCFSFYPTKNLGAYGDGGAITTAHKRLYQKLLLLRNYGWKKRYISHVRGYNSRLDELQAAILLVKLRHLGTWNARRNYLASLYIKHISPQCLSLPKPHGAGERVFHLFVIKSASRDRLRKYLKEHGVYTAVQYPLPVHLQKAFKDLGYKRGDFPVAERNAQQIISLPLYPELTDREVLYVSRKINEFYA